MMAEQVEKSPRAPTDETTVTSQTLQLINREEDENNNDGGPKSLFASGLNGVNKKAAKLPENNVHCTNFPHTMLKIELCRLSDDYSLLKLNPRWQKTIIIGGIQIMNPNFTN